jgi:hypothetical protein
MDVVVVLSAGLLGLEILVPCRFLKRMAILLRFLKHGHLFVMVVTFYEIKIF